MIQQNSSQMGFVTQKEEKSDLELKLLFPSKTLRFGAPAPQWKFETNMKKGTAQFLD